MWKSPVNDAVNVEVSSFVWGSNKTRNSLGTLDLTIGRLFEARQAALSGIGPP